MESQSVEKQHQGEQDEDFKESWYGFDPPFGLKAFYPHHVGCPGDPDRVAGGNDNQVAFRYPAGIQGRAGGIGDHLIRIMTGCHEPGHTAPTEGKPTDGRAIGREGDDDPPRSVTGNMPRGPA